MSCLFFHDWKLVREGVADVGHESILFRKRWREEAIARLYRCKRCGAEKGELTSLDGSKQSIDPMFLKEN